MDDTCSRGYFDVPFTDLKLFSLALLEKKIDVYISPFLKPISLLQFFLLLWTVTLDKSKIIVTKSGLIAQNSRITLMLEIYSRRTSKISCLDTWLQNVN